MRERLLDDSQADVVEIAPDARQIVIAGPGSGKTEVVSALIEHMVQENDVDATHGLLVISFSNAAIHAAEARLRAHAVRPVSVQTMDSLAADILRDLAVGDYSRSDFDGQVLSATELLSTEGWDRIGDLEHLIVDEVQDVVGVRADFLTAIVAALPASTGFTLLGDPAQGIYDFQLRQDSKRRQPRSTTTSVKLLDSVSAVGPVATRNLTGQYRATSRDARAAARLRHAVLPGGDPKELEDFLAALVDLGQVEDLLEAVASWSGTTALLTATNGQALRTAGALRDAGMRTEIRRSARQQLAARWIAELLGDAPADTIKRAEFEKSVASRRPDLDAAVCWRALRSISGGRGTEVSLPRIASWLRSSGPLLPDLSEPPCGRVVVSTVHRAKGLEFDNIVLLDFPERPWAEDEPDPDELLRSRFVALTRARMHLARAGGPDDRRIRRFSKYGLNRERWIAGGPKQWMTFGFEIGFGDIEPILEDPAAGQHALSSSVAVGDPLELRLDVEASTLTLPIYSVLHDGALLARTSLAFGEDMTARIGTLERRKCSWPQLAGARVEGIGTFVSDARVGSPWRHGLLLVPVVTGLLTLDWNGASA